MTLFRDAVLGDIARVDTPTARFQELVRARRAAQGVHAPQAVFDEHDEALRGLQRVALSSDGDGDRFGGMDAEQLAAEVAEIDRRVMARRSVS